MKHLPLLLLLLLGFSASAQRLDNDEARFFAETLHEQDVLTVTGYEELVTRINKGRLGIFKPRRSIGVSTSGQQPLSVSGFISYLGYVYSREYDFRTAKTQMQEKAMTLFGNPPPIRLSTDQEEELLGWARGTLAEEEGPSIERALGHDVFAEGILPPFFMQFARSQSISRKNPRFKTLADAFQPQISASRSVLGHDVELLLDNLEELGLITVQDRAQLRNPEKVRPDQYVLKEIAKIVEARESRPKNIADNLTYLDLAAKADLIDKDNLAALRNDSTFLHGSHKLPAIRRFQRGVSSLKTAIGSTPNQSTSLKSLGAALQKLDPVFAGIGFDYEVTPNTEEPTRPYQDGPDLTIIITGGKEAIRVTERTSRSRLDDEGNPSFWVSPELVIRLNDYLTVAGSDKELYAMAVRPNTRSTEPPKAKETIFLLLDKQEAKGLIVRTMEEMFMGPTGLRARH